MKKTFTLEDVTRLMKSENYNQAEGMLHEMIKQRPGAWEPHFYLANLMMMTNRNGLCIPLLYRATQINSKVPEIWNNLGTSLRRENHVEPAREAYEQAEKLNAEDPDLYNNLGTLYINEGAPGGGEKYLRKAIELSPEHVQAHWNLGLILLEQKRWREGWEHYAYGKGSKDRMNRWMRWPQYKGEKGKTVLTYGEQGLGDEIMFASMLSDLQVDADRVICECHPRLKGLFERSFPEIDFYPTRKNAVLEWDDFFDSVIATGDLGSLYRNDDRDFPKEPYLGADSCEVARMGTKLESIGPPPYIGIGWKAGYKKTRKELRTIPLDMWKLIIESGATIISLQYTTDADIEVAAFNKESPVKIHHWPDIVRDDDYDSTAALVSALDLSILVNTSAVHLCGALGAPCWTLTPSRPAWRYSLEGDEMPWYRSVKQYRQEGEDWTPTLNRLTEDLKEWMKPFQKNTGSLTSNSMTNEMTMGQMVAVGAK